MTNFLGEILLFILFAVIILIVAGYVVHYFYKRGRKEIAFVRTGMGGEKVILDTGGFVLPIVHDVTYVNMNIISIGVELKHEEAAVSKDHVRTDIQADFLVKVIAEKRAVALAAASFGNKTQQQEALSQLLSSQFISILRTTIAQFSIDEIHISREKFIQEVTQKATVLLAKNGLELESLSLIRLDQTDLDYFRTTNTFDADGLSKIVQSIEEKRKIRNAVEQETLVQIRQNNLQAERQILKIDEDIETAKLEKEKVLEERQNRQRAELKRQRVTEDADAEKIRIATEQEVSLQEVKTQQELEQARIKQENVSKEKEILIAEYQSKLELIAAKQQADKTKIIAESEIVSGEAEAENQRKINEAENALSNEARVARFKTKLADKMPEIIRESVSPLKHVDGIKIFHVDGMNNNTGAGTSPTDEVIGSVLKYRAQAPLIDQMMKEIGIEEAGVAKMGDVFRNAKDAKSLLESNDTKQNNLNIEDKSNKSK